MRELTPRQAAGMETIMKRNLIAFWYRNLRRLKAAWWCLLGRGVVFRAEFRGAVSFVESTHPTFVADNVFWGAEG